VRFIHSIQGSVALRVSGDEVAPEGGINYREFFELVAAKYNFAVRPQLPPGVPFLPGGQTHIFQSGTFVSGGERWPIMQLASIPNGDIVTAATTEIADSVLNDYMAKLDEKLKFRFSSATKKRRSYQSNIVVQFESGIEERIEGLKKIEVFLAREIPRRGAPFKIKRLAFGYGNPIPTLTLENIENSDFALERRGDEPYSENRYACSAPVSTSEHIRILEAMERELAPGTR
jgi:hypothetical protein